MPSNKYFTAYCEQVSEQIRWKRMRGVVTRELEQHLCDQQDAYLAQGKEEEEAARMAVAQMGDARTVGQALDKAHRPQTPWLPLALILLLLALGLALQSQLSSDAMPVASYGLAVVVFLLSYFLDISWLGRHAGQVYGLVLAVSLLALFCADPTSSVAVLSLPPFQIMLGNLALIFPMAYSLLVYQMRGRGMAGIVFCFLGYLPFALILLWIPTISGFLIYTLAGLTVLCAAVWQGWFQVRRLPGLTLVLTPPLICFGIGFANLFSSQSLRLRSFFNPQLDPDGYGYLYGKLREVVAHAAFWGEGTGDLSFIPNLNTDHALLYGIHHFGWGAFLVLMLLSAGLCIWCVCRGLRQKSIFGKLLVLTVSTAFALQVLTYSVSNLGYGFFGTISFPFVSYGGTALVLNALLMGCMLSVFRTGPWIHDAGAKIQPITPQRWA